MDSAEEAQGDVPARPVISGNRRDERVVSEGARERCVEL
jgi:hypothetical protein